jgi:hypothetical protein
MICQLSDAALKDILVERIDQSELVGVHRNPDAVLPDESAERGEFIPEIILPVKPADRVRGERNKAGIDPEKKKPVSDIEFESLAQAIQVACDRLYEAIFRIRLEPESPVAAIQCRIDAGISYSQLQPASVWVYNCLKSLILKHFHEIAGE